MLPLSPPLSLPYLVLEGDDTATMPEHVQSDDEGRREGVNDGHAGLDLEPAKAEGGREGG